MLSDRIVAESLDNSVVGQRKGDIMRGSESTLYGNVASNSESLSSLDRIYPEDVGIVAMEIYFPKRYIEQSELEEYDNVSKGKYTIGLGQERLAFCDDREDVNSMSLTVVKNLMEKYNISYQDIGRLEVGTETVVDKSKSVKTHLMDLFSIHGNTNIEGVTTSNACYGGTSALFNAIQWIESSYWDGRYAIVVAVDIAIYAAGPARPTSGAGAVAMLIGSNSIISMDRGLRGTYMANVYDFYKPNLSSEYPIVDGPLSVGCFMKAVDFCSQSYLKGKKLQRILDVGDYYLFHSPYSKIVNKAYARLSYNDMKRVEEISTLDECYRNVLQIPIEKSYDDKQLEKLFITHTTKEFSIKTEPSLLVCRQVGNMYCASLYASLISLLASKVESYEEGEQFIGKKIVMFSYGSGLASSMFSLSVKRNVYSMMEKINLNQRLSQRTKCHPSIFDDLMKLRECKHNAVEYYPIGDIDKGLWPKSYYLEYIDSKYRRKYAFRK